MDRIRRALHSTTLQKPDASKKPASLCSNCADLTQKPFWWNIKQLDPRRKFEFTWSDFGEYEDGYLASRCPLCLLIIRTLRQHPTLRPLAESAAPVKIYMNKLFDTWLVDATVGIGRVQIGDIDVCQILNFSAEFFSEDRQPALDWYRQVSEEDQIDFATIKTWVADCEEHHDDEPLLARTLVSDEILLIDVLAQRLVPSDTSERYLTLSYHWNAPAASMFLTTSDNCETLQIEGALAEINASLPKLIRDSMYLVKQIGERYLWVDTLCILRDDENVIASQVDMMHLIYGKSLATIVVMATVKAHDPLPGVSKSSRNAPVCIDEQNAALSSVVCRYPDLAILATQTKYETRAWTLQERLLAQRCMLFTDNEVFFLCPSGSYRETLNGAVIDDTKQSQCSRKFVQSMPHLAANSRAWYLAGKTDLSSTSG